MNRPTTRGTADACYGACLAEWTEAECTQHRQHCGMPMNSATNEGAGTDRHVQCIQGALGRQTGQSAGDAFRAAAIECSRPPA